jgi:hypothetical protein
VKLRGALRFLAKVARPLLKVIGVKAGTVADKAAEGVEIIDRALPEDKPTNT